MQSLIFRWLLPAKFVFDQEEKFNATAIDSHVAQIVDVDKVFADSPFNETESADSTPTIIDKGPLVTRRSSLTIEYPLKEIQNNFSNNNLGTHKSGRKRSYSVENLKSGKNYDFGFLV